MRWLNSVRCSSSIASSSRSRVLASSHVLGGDDRAALGDDPLGDLAHLQDGGADVGGHGGLGVAQPRDLGDVAGEVAHALEVGAHAHRRDDHAQVGGDGLLAGEQVDGEGVEALAQRSSSLSASMTDSASWMSASSSAVVARDMADPARRVISTSWSEIVSRSS